MFNEEQGVSHLLETLHRLRNDLRDIYALRCILVDDGSTDGTWGLLQSAWDGREDVQLIRHEKNRGISAAIMTGIRAAESEIVCSMDSDCSYDPQDLKNMVPLLEGAAMVTASPYHPDGRVVNVPAWRLFLSRNLSRLYSLILRNKLYTYTSCFRVYRRSVVANLELENSDFLGIAELVIQLIRAGQRVVEYPAVLGTRKFGASKMKTMKTIRGHLRLLWGIK
jgi:glycosyltransferase involved in cell wall biosynthesis